MIRDIYDTIKKELLKLDLKESKEYFDLEGSPDSLTNNSFIIKPIDFNPGEFAETQNKSQFNKAIINLQPVFIILISKKITANHRNEINIDLATIKENIIKALMKITGGVGELDKIGFTGSTSAEAGVNLISELNFVIDYRINNL